MSHYDNLAYASTRYQELVFLICRLEFLVTSLLRVTQLLAFVVDPLYHPAGFSQRLTVGLTVKYKHGDLQQFLVPYYCSPVVPEYRPVQLLLIPTSTHLQHAMTLLLFISLAPYLCQVSEHLIRYLLIFNYCLCVAVI